MSDLETKPPNDRTDRIREGDLAALADAFDDYRARLERIVSFRMHPKLIGRVDPDDVLQETYLEASRRYTHLKGDTEESLFIWLRLMALQTLTDTHRRHMGTAMRDPGREQAIHRNVSSDSTSTSLAANLIGQFTSPTLAARREELADKLRVTLDRMDRIDREVLALRHFEELSNNEIAEALGIEQKAASIRYVRALKRLKDILAEMPGFEEGPLTRP